VYQCYKFINSAPCIVHEGHRYTTQLSQHLANITDLKQESPAVADKPARRLKSGSRVNQGSAVGRGCTPKMSRKNNRQIPHFWAEYLHYMDFFLVFSNFSLATLARLYSIKFLFPKLEIWACNVTSKSDYVFYIFGFVVIDS